jgi:integrase
MSRTELGNAIGLPYNSISHWWKKQRKAFPTADDVLRVAKTLDTTVEYLLTGKQPKSHFNIRLQHVYELLDPLTDDELEDVVKYIQYIYHQRDKTFFLATKIAFLAGLRNSEVVGLYTDDVQDLVIPGKDGELRLSYLRISHQWNRKVKSRTLVKDKDVRNVPITPELRNELDPLLTGSVRFVFSFHPRQETPITPNRLRDWYYKRLEAAAGIDKAVRETRRIAFHSGRRFFNTFLQNEGIPKHTIQKLTGHDDDSMTEYYTDYLPEDV